MKKQFTFITAGILAGVVAISSITTVPAGHRGVLLQMGEVKPTILTEGFHLKAPFIQNVIPVEVRIQKSESAQMAASKDLQNVTTKVAVNFSINPQTVNELYQNIGLDYHNRIIDPAVSESLKSVTAQYTAEELISKRTEVSQMIKDTLQKKLSRYNLVLEEINIKEFSFSKEFSQAIENKQSAEQRSQKALRDLERIKIEAEQKVAQAKAEAESLKLKKLEVTPELVQLKQIEVAEKALDVQLEAINKWNGTLPNVTGGATPFVDVDKYQAKP